MVKKILLLPLCLVSFSIIAQTTPATSDAFYVDPNWGQRHFYFGLNFTPGIYWVHPNSSNITSNGASFGYGYGANLEFYFARNYGIVLGLEVSNLDAKYINTTSTTTPRYDSIATNDESLQYLQLPILLKMKTSPFGRVQYYGVIGAQLGFLLSAKNDYTTNITPINNAPPYSYTDNNMNIYRQTDFFRASFVIGLGAEYRLFSTTAIQASLTYNSSFTNVNSSGSNSATVKGVELMLGVLF